ncbi:oxidoreductase [Patescibacteria group bacterium]|nr:oxidoreductase [Patescibacteria group bacterium]
MINTIDSFLNKTTMYRLTLYYLIMLVGVATFAGLFGLMPYQPLDIILSTLLAVLICDISNLVFSKFFHATTNTESYLITALILVLIIPTKFPSNVSFLILASGFAMISKYLLTVEKKHIFNPAAAAVAGVALLSPEHIATWWVGTPVMLPFVFAGGLLLVRKIERESLVSVFISVYLILVALFAIFHTGSITSLITTFKDSLLHTALFFFTFVMLTEPITSPATKKHQSRYSALTALLYATPQLHLLGIVVTPEVALCISNIYSYIVNPKYRLSLMLRNKLRLSPDTFAYIFDTPDKIKYIPGQYMEWTLPHDNSDNRGDRRYFSLASSPTEQNLIIAVKFYVPSSSYKRALYNLMPNQKIIAAQLSGDFVMPDNPQVPLVFIAGGVGVAPFRSMIRYIVDKKIKCNIVLFFINRTIQDIYFADTLAESEKYGVRTVYSLTDTAAIPQNWKGKVGRPTPEMIKVEVPDWGNRTYYISGPQLMVQSIENMLKGMGINKGNIKTDFFPGYAES